MKNQKSVSMPYPVLGIDGDFTEGKLLIGANIYSDEEFLFVEIEDFDISNKYVKTLQESGKVTLVCKVDCASTLYNETLFYDESAFKIPTKNLANQVIFEFFLITSEDIPDYHDETFSEDFFVGGSDGSFSLTRGDIIGFAGSYSINLDKTFAEGLKSLFDWREYADSELAFVNFSTDSKKIVIHYPKIQGGDNLLNQISSTKSKTFLALFILPALNYAFAQMVDVISSQEDIQSFCEENEWAYFLKENYDKWNQEDTYQSAQEFLMILMATKWQHNLSPITYAVDEVVGLRLK